MFAHLGLSFGKQSRTMSVVIRYFAERRTDQRSRGQILPWRDEQQACHRPHTNAHQNTREIVRQGEEKKAATKNNPFTRRYKVTAL